jgi:hypothetical protein
MKGPVGTPEADEGLGFAYVERPIFGGDILGCNSVSLTLEGTRSRQERHQMRQAPPKRPRFAMESA